MIIRRTFGYNRQQESDRSWDAYKGFEGRLSLRSEFLDENTKIRTESMPHNSQQMSCIMLRVFSYV